MISQRIVRMIEERAHSLTQQWLRAIKRSQKTPAFHNVDKALLYERCYAVYSELSHWLDHRASKLTIVEFFINLGRKRFHEGIPLSQLVYALVLHRRILYLFMDERGLIGDDAFALQQALELTNRVLVFYDRATFYTSFGYEEALIAHLGGCTAGRDKQPCEVARFAANALRHSTTWDALRQGLSENP